jgi:hypothetical protein
MRFYEFAPVRYLQTPAVSNAPAEPFTQVKNIPVIPDAVKHQRVQQQLAAQIAHNANQVQPTKQDLALAFFKYGEAQSEANKELELKQQKVAAMGKRAMGKRIGR